MSDERTPERTSQRPFGRGDEALLDLIAEVACAMFQAKAASVILHDASSDELVVAAASGQAGVGTTGIRIPLEVGIAGRVFGDGVPVAVDDVAGDERFAREIAETTGYVPTGLMAAPLTDGERTIGVLEVLDRPQFSRFSLAELDLLTHFARVSGAAIGRTWRAR
ncbi:MAG TPA: GAF domain-containing protein [Gaiellales bacterium]|nr:GAF domain-containing protein [Gaiellales bacterium]